MLLYLTQPFRKSLADELKDAEQEALKEISEDEDVRNVVAMLENVEFTDSMPLSTYNDGKRTIGGQVSCDVEYESSGGENITPRNKQSSAIDDVTQHTPTSRSPVSYEAKAANSIRKVPSSRSESDQSEEGRRQDRSGKFR